ncbi:MAG: hypothetical protein Q4E50_03520 [Tissierellia bacterium]|nr:hypothetical protein [Tissierellia bacterium]
MYYCSSGDDERCKGDFHNFLAISLHEVDENEKAYIIYDFYTDKNRKDEPESFLSFAPPGHPYNDLGKNYRILDEGKFKLNFEDITFLSDTGEEQETKLSHQLIDYEVDGKKLQFKKFTNATHPVWIPKMDPPE